MALGLSSLLGTPTVQALGAGLLTGALAGGALVVAGAIPPAEAPTAGTVALLACPGEGPALATISDGERLLVTARSADGKWLEVYIGQPGIDRAWADAAALTLDASGDGLPVADCAGPEPAPLPSPPPAPTLQPTEAPTAEPTLGPSPTATPSATATQAATATATAHVTATATPKPTKTASPTPTKTPTPPPPTPTPTPTPTPAPTPDNADPTVQNLHNSNQCIDPSPGSQSTIQVRAIDNVAVSGVKITIIPEHGTGLITNMTMTAGAPKDGIWSYVLTGSAAFSRSWGEGYVDYNVKATDTNGNVSIAIGSDRNSLDNFIRYQPISSCSIG